MFFPILGLSVFLHLLIILVAKMVLKYRGEKLISAFQMQEKHGGVVKSGFVNSLIAYSLVVMVALYMSIVASIALIAAFRIGAGDPHRQFYNYVIETMVTNFGAIQSAVGVLAIGYVLLTLKNPRLISFFPRLATKVVFVSIDTLYLLIIAITLRSVSALHNISLSLGQIPRMFSNGIGRISGGRISGVTSVQLMVVLAMLALMLIVLSFIPFFV